ncbi:MAG: hypothetical protein ACRDY6_12300 [Acidimicrobiia bacterium]
MVEIGKAHRLAPAAVLEDLDVEEHARGAAQHDRIALDDDVTAQEAADAREHPTHRAERVFDVGEQQLRQPTP